MGEQLIWIAGDSSTYVLYAVGVSTDRSVPMIEGIGLPTLEHTSQPFPFLHGALDIARRFRDRTVQMTFKQTWSTRANWQAGRQALATALNPDLGMGQLKFIDAAANDWRLDAWVVNAPLPRGPFHWERMETVLEFWAPWPFWRKASQESDSGVFSGTGNVDIAVSNGGNMPTIPSTITITGQATNPLLTILGTSLKIDLRNTIAAGQTATITCFPPDEVAAVKAGSSVIGDLTYDSVLAGFELPRGASTVRITGGNAGDNGTVTIYFYEWYLGL